MNKWISGNKITLLENGEEFFPRVFECIAAATKEVVIETFILFDDKVGQALHAALLKAAARGAQIDVTVDGYGSFNLNEAFLSGLVAAGVRVHVFDPATKLWHWRTNMFRRMHRKIVVIDHERAFVGGINYGADHLADFGPRGKQDYAVEIEGPLVATIDDFVHRSLEAGQRNARGGRFIGGQTASGPGQSPGAQVSRLNNENAASRLLPRNWRRSKGNAVTVLEPSAGGLAPVGSAEAMFVTRDNSKHTTDIEKHYSIAIRSAHHRVVIANAYFFPGYRLIKQMRKAARRGVDVSLILQGQPDMPIVKIAGSMLYHHLADAGVKIFEYCERPLHGKVALSDYEWATVGSSNLDPLSLSLNLEANVIIKDRSFNEALNAKLQYLMAHNCREIRAQDLERPGFWATVRSYLVFHLLRHYPSWAGLLPAHQPRLRPAYVPDSPIVLPEAASLAASAAARLADKNPQSGGVDAVSHADPA